MPERSFVERAVSLADVNALRMALYQATRDPVITDIQPTRVPGATHDVVTFTPDEEDLIQSRAVDFLMSGPDADALPRPSDTEIAEMIVMAEARNLDPDERVMRGYLPAFDDMPHRAQWTRDTTIPDGYEVAIIGAGFAGIAMGVQLEQLGIPYTIYERRLEVGGVWSINTYPDARVDTPSASYEFSFEKKYPWTEHFARQSEVRGYLEHIATKYGVANNIVYDADVAEARFDDISQQWALKVNHVHRQKTEHRANVVITASGLFATARALPVEGASKFHGQIVHTTQWDSSIDYGGRKVAIIGNGSTGVQLLSKIAETASEVTVYQRTPQWIAPRPLYGEPVADELQWLVQTMPFYWHWNKYVAGMGPNELREVLIPDEEWIQAGGEVNRRNDSLREMLKKYVAQQVGGRQDLIDKLIPDYPPMTRRPVVDNNWYASLTRDNVELVTTPIEQMTAHAIETVDGKMRGADLVIAAVGFETEKYLWPTEYYGSDGLSLEHVWSSEGAQAYLGMTVPNFPNMFMLYGPNAQPVASGSGFPGWLEIWSRYIAEAIVAMIEGGNSSMVVRQETFETYNTLMHKEASKLIYLSNSSAKKRNYYLNEWGRLQVNAPWSGEQFYAMCAHPRATDFDFKNWQ